MYYVNPEKEMVEEESLFESAQMDPVMAVRHVCVDKDGIDTLF